MVENNHADFNWKRCTLRSIIIALAVMIAELVPQFDLVMGIIGGTLTGPLIFILPPLFYHRLIRMERHFDERNEHNDTLNPLNGTNFGDDENILNDLDDQQQQQHDQQRRHTDNYGTFTKLPQRFISQSSWLFCFCNESLVCISVVFFGIIVTITSTYFNLLTASNFDEFRSPCIQNISLSFAEL